MPETAVPSKIGRRAIAERLLRRLVKYSGVGIGTYILDMGIIAVMVYGLELPFQPSVAVGFFTGLTVNYLLSYHWVFRGTKRDRFVGYIIFATLALFGVFFITRSVVFLIEEYDMHILIARTIVASFVGLTGFFINTFFNFKLI